jgi:Flagellar Assembly Protein A N-terminal region
MAEVQEKKELSRYIKKSLESFAAENFLPLAECDFTLLKTNTYIKSNTSGEFELFSQETLKDYLGRDKILNEHIEIQQQHQFTLHAIKECKIKLDYAVELYEYASHPKIVLSPDSIIPHTLYTPKELLKVLFYEFNKIKAYHGILIRIFDETMVNNLKVLVKYIYMGKFTKKVKITLFDGIEPVLTRKSQLIYWFKEKEEKSQVIEVDANEVLIEYKKPIFGKSGFNAYGQLINVDYVRNIDDIEANMDEDSIYIKEDKNSKSYIAKKQGYVHFNERHLCVNNNINLDKLSRNARSVASQEENSIQVTVSQHDTNRDSIGEGVSLKSESIHIDGFVGAKSVLEALNLSIDGATHQDSTQYAKFATINRHKGKLRCHHAKIALLEGGEIHATSVEIESSLGGSIYAKDVIIGHVKSNLKVYASNSITIKLISGEDNLLHIGYKQIPVLKSKIDFIHTDIEDLKYSLEEARRHNHSEIQPIQKKIQDLKNEANSIITAYKDAKITIEQPCRGLNNIIFSIDDDHEISYKTEERQYSTFYLELDENKITLLPIKKSIQIEE